MTATYQSLSPHSAFFSPEFRKPSHYLPSTTFSFASSSRATISRSSLFQSLCQLDDNFVQRLDRTEILGGHDDDHNLVGHSGCVNALGWSQSGELLASGGDDRNVILWKLGAAEHHPAGTKTKQSSRRNPFVFGTGSVSIFHEHRSSDGEEEPDEASDRQVDREVSVVAGWPQRSFPGMNMGMLGKIQTGHSANIFSVKWAPYSSDRRILSCAGDRRVRVFDVNYSPGVGTGSGQIRQMAGKEYTLWNESSGACVKIFRCHKDRVKRISTENSPDIFLTCSEDGDVRQMDLRTPHRCVPNQHYGEGCPSPLAHFPMGLYSLSVSRSEPWLFAVAGMSKYAYLQDRRMIPRLLRQEWGITVGSADPEAAERQALTMCVRRFGQSPGGFDSPWMEQDGQTVRTPYMREDGHSRPARREGNDDEDEDVHITACKLNESTGRELIVSYSNGGIYRFGVYDEPSVLHYEPQDRVYPRHTADSFGPDSRSRREPEKDEETRQSLTPYTTSMRRRCLEALFPTSISVSGPEQGGDPAHVAGRIEAFWDDVKDLDDLLMADRDEGGEHTREYWGAKLCHLLGHFAFSATREGGMNTNHEALVEAISNYIHTSHTSKPDSIHNVDITPLLYELEDDFDWEDRARFEEITEELWQKSRQVFKEFWPDVQDALSLPRSESIQGGRSKKRARMLGQDGSEDTHSDEPKTETGDQREGKMELEAISDDQDEEEEEADDDEYDEDFASELDSEVELNLGDFGGSPAFETNMSAGIEDALKLAPIVFPRNKMEGHANVETVKDVNFAGRDDRYVVSGSDDGNWFMWDTETSELEGIWKGDSSVVNVLQPHPSLPIMAISGIDDTIKLFGPVTLSGEGGAAVRVAVQMANKDEILRKNKEKVTTSMRRPGLTTRTLLSMLQQHVFHSASEDLQVAVPGRVVARRTGGLVSLSVGPPREGEEAGTEEDECIVM